MNNMRNVFMLFLVLIFLVVVEYNSEKKQTALAVPDAKGMQQVLVIAGNYFYRPNRIVVKVNVPVELTVWKASGPIPHNFVLQAAEAGINIEEELSQEPTKIVFTPKAPGKFPFYCSGGPIESHREKGMEGVLEVTEPAGGRAGSKS